MSIYRLTNRFVTRRFTVLAGMLIAIILLVAAGSAESWAATNGTEVGGNITTNTTWTLSGSPYIATANVNVQSGAKLTIQPGVVVKFNPGTRMRVFGVLVAQGNTSNPITFTSNSSSPGRGDWVNITFQKVTATSAEPIDLEAIEQNILQHCVVEFAGLAGAGDKGAVRNEGAPLRIDTCSIRYNAQGGIRILNSGGFSVFINNNLIEDNVYNGDGGGVYAVDSTVQNNVIRDNSATDRGGGLFAERVSIYNNVVKGNLAGNGGGGIYANDSPLSGNFVAENHGRQGGGVYAVDSNFSFNTLVGNTSSDRGGGVYFLGSSLFQQNSVIANTSPAGFAFGGVEILGTPSVNLNNIYGNTPFDLVLDSTTDINAQNNYWATTDTGTILGRIFDKFDDSNRGLVTFQPFLSDATEPIPPPLGLMGTLNNDSINLSWQPLPATSATYTYKVNYRFAPGPPYNGTGLPEGNSPIDVGSATSFTLTGISGAPVFIAITAEDNSGNVSWYSNEVNTFKKFFLSVIGVRYANTGATPVRSP